MSHAVLAVQCISVMATCHEDLSTVKDLVTFMKGQVERLTSETTVSSILRLTALNKVCSPLCVNS